MKHKNIKTRTYSTNHSAPLASLKKNNLAQYMYVYISLLYVSGRRWSDNKCRQMPRTRLTACVLTSKLLLKNWRFFVSGDDSSELRSFRRSFRVVGDVKLDAPDWPRHGAAFTTACSAAAVVGAVLFLVDVEQRVGVAIRRVFTVVNSVVVFRHSVIIIRPARVLIQLRIVNNSWSTLSPPIPLTLYTSEYWSIPPFLIFDIRALWRSVLSARAPEC